MPDSVSPNTIVVTACFARRRRPRCRNGTAGRTRATPELHGAVRSGTAGHPRRCRPSCRNTPPGGLVGAAPRSRSRTGPPPLRTRRVSYGEAGGFLSLVGLYSGGSMMQPTGESGEVLQPEASGPSPRRRPTCILGCLRLGPRRQACSFVPGGILHRSRRCAACDSGSAPP